MANRQSLCLGAFLKFSSFTLVGNDVKKIIAFYQQHLKQFILTFDVAFLAWQRDKSKKEILNVYQIGRFLFSLKKILSTQQKYKNDLTTALHEKHFRAINNYIIESL